MVLVFDINGTLLDTSALAPHISRIFGKKLSPNQWFTQLLQYAMAITLAGDYQDFAQLATATLEMCADSAAIKLPTRQIEAVKSQMRRLPPFPDVKPSLRRLQQNGFRLAALTNSNPAALKEQLHKSGLSRYFEQAISIEAVKKYKPAPEVYTYAANSLGIQTHELLMVAAHPWDLLGATAAGCRTAFLNRPGHAWFPAAPYPNYRAKDLTELTDQLLGVIKPKPLASRLPKNYALLGSAALVLGMVSVMVPAISPQLPTNLASD